MKHYSSLIVICMILWRSSTGEGHQCSDKFHELVKGLKLEHCHRLPTHGAELGWSNPEKSKVVEVVFGAPLDEEKGWLAWGVNPGPHARMVGTRAAIGIKDPAKGPFCHTYNVTYETRIGCQLRPSDLDEIKCSRFDYDASTGYHLITAKLNTSSTNVSKLNIVWQIGWDVDGDEPKKHVATLKNVDSVETLDLYTGKSSGTTHMKINLRKVHGVLNIVGWGTLLPIGVIIARYFRKFPFESDEWWFYIHVSCQSTGFLIGVIGWGIGMWLAHNSPRYIFYTHHVFAIFIFVFATLQTLALRFRPTQEDDFRRVWNIYHHFLGYTLLALIFINIFEGIRILKPDKENWRFAVVGILVALGTITLILECFTWKRFIDDRKKFFVPPGTVKPGAEEENPGGAQSSPSQENLFDDKNNRGKSENLPAQPGGGDPRGAQSSLSQPSIVSDIENNRSKSVNLPAGPVQSGGGDPRGAQSSLSQSNIVADVKNKRSKSVNLPAGPVQPGGGDPRGAQSSLSQPSIVSDIENNRSKSVNLPAGPIQSGGGDPRGAQSSLSQSNIVADVKNKRSKSVNLPAGPVQPGGGDPRGA